MSTATLKDSLQDHAHDASADASANVMSAAGGDTGYKSELATQAFRKLMPAELSSVVDAKEDSIRDILRDLFNGSIKFPTAVRRISAEINEAVDIPRVPEWMEEEIFEKVAEAILTVGRWL